MGRKQNFKKMDKLFNEIMENCNKCDSHELCDIIKKLKIIHFAVRDLDKATYNIRLKVGIVLILEFILILMIFIYPSQLLYIVAIFILIEIYIYSQKHKYKKESIYQLEILGNELGMSEERQKEMRRSLEGKPTVIAEKMMNCKLRKEHGLNYCVKCPDNYACASGCPSQSTKKCI